MPSQQPTFVIGSPRSGTSLLYALLTGHPDLAYPDIATQRMLSLRPILALERLGVDVAAIRGVHRRFLPRPGSVPYEPEVAFLDLDPHLPAEGSFLWASVGLHVAPDSLRPEHFRNNPGRAALVRRRYAGLARRSRCARVVDKSPSYVGYLEAIREVFPDAYVVHIIRDGRAVVNSIAYAFKYRKGADGAPWMGSEAKWWGPPPENAAELEQLGPVERACHQWPDLVRRARSAETLFPRRYVELRYEQLTAAVRPTLLDTFERLGLPSFDLGHYPERFTDRNFKWQQSAETSFGDEIWTDRVSIDPSEFEALEVMRPLLEELGYVERGAELVRSD